MENSAMAEHAWILNLVTGLFLQDTFFLCAEFSETIGPHFTLE